MTASAPTTTVTIRAVQPGERQFWKCRCGRTLGERVDDQLVIKEGRTTITASKPFAIGRSCPKCGVWNSYTELVLT